MNNTIHSLETNSQNGISMFVNNKDVIEFLKDTKTFSSLETFKINIDNLKFTIETQNIDLIKLKEYLTQTYIIPFEKSTTSIKFKFEVKDNNFIITYNDENFKDINDKIMKQLFIMFKNEFEKKLFINLHSEMFSEIIFNKIISNEQFKKYENELQNIEIEKRKQIIEKKIVSHNIENPSLPIFIDVQSSEWAFSESMIDVGFLPVFTFKNIKKSEYGYLKNVFENIFDKVNQKIGCEYISKELLEAFDEEEKYIVLEKNMKKRYGLNFSLNSYFLGLYFIDELKKNEYLEIDDSYILSVEDSFEYMFEGLSNLSKSEKKELLEDLSFEKYLKCSEFKDLDNLSKKAKKFIDDEIFLLFDKNMNLIITNFRDNQIISCSKLDKKIENKKENEQKTYGTSINLL